MKSKFARPAFLTCILFAATVHAAEQTYDDTNPAAVWNTTTANWDGSAATWTNGNLAFFTAGTGTVTVADGIGLAELVVSSTTESTIGGVANSVYRFNGGSLSFGAALGVIDTQGTGLRNSQINSRLLGSGGLEVYATGVDAGQGRLVLGGDNTGLSGGITVKTGLLAFTTPKAAGSNAITLDGGGIFGPVNHSGTGGTLVTGPTDQLLANPVELAAGSNRIRVWGGRNLFLTGNISGAGDLRKVDGGALFLGAVPGFTGTTTVAQGTLVTPGIQSLGTNTIQIGGTGQPALGFMGTGETTDRVINFSTGSGGFITTHGNAGLHFTSDMTGAATPMGIVFNGGGVGSINGVSTGALVNFNKQGIGTWTVNGGLNLVGGELRAQGGILKMSATSSTVADANITRANNGVIRLASGSGVTTATVNTSGILGGWATFDDITWAKTNGAGNAVDAFTAFTDDTWAAGVNTNVTLAGPNPAADSTTHSLRFLESGAKTLTLSGTNTITSGGILVTTNVGSDTTTITGGTLLGANTLDLVLHQFNNAGPLVIDSIIANNTGNTGLTKTGAGTVVLNGANSYRGTTRVFEGTLVVNANLNHGASPNKFYEVTSNATLELGYSTPGAVYGYGVTVSGAGSASPAGLYLRGGTLFNLQSTLRLTGLPSTVRTSGTGNATLAGWDNNGTHLAVENTASGSVIVPEVNFTSGSWGYVMNIAPGLSTATGDLTIKGNFAGGAVFRKNGFGSVRLDGSGTSTNTGAFDVRQGSLILAGADNRVGTGSNIILGLGGDSGLLVLEGINQTLTALTNAGTGTESRVVAGSATISNLTINNGGDTTIAAALGGSGPHHNNLALTKNGIGTLTLAGASSFVGDTTINAGSLRLDYSTHDNSKLSDIGTLTLGGNLILTGGSHQEIVGQTIVTAASSVTRPAGSAVIDFGALSRTGSATLNLAAANLARTTTSNDPSGRLPTWVTIDSSPAANDGAGNIVVYVPAFVDVVRLGGKIPNNSTADVRIVDGGTTGPITLASPGLSDILSLTQTATGGPATVALGGGTLRLGEVGTITATPGASALTIQGGMLTAGGTDDNPGTLTVTGEAVVTLGAVLADNGAGPVTLAKSGPGSLTLNAPNDHTGGIMLNGGQLLLGDPFCFGLGGGFTLNGGAFDNVTGDALIVNDTVPQVWNGDFTFLGSHDLTFQSGGVNVTGNRQVTIAAATLEIQSPVSGGSGFTKLGSGTLLLSNGANNWTGTTTVSGGVLEIPSRTADGPYVVNPGGTLRLGYTTGGGYAATGMQLHGDGVDATTGLYLRGGASYNASGQIQLLTAPTTIRHYGEGLAQIGMFDINGNGLVGSAASSGSVIDANIEIVSRGFGMSVNIPVGAETATGDLVINGRLNVGSLGFYKRGAGSVALNGVATAANTAVRIEAGSIITGVAGAIGANAALPISAGASLIMHGFSQEVGSLSGAGAVVNGSATTATLAVNQTADQTFSGALGGADAEANNFALVKNGAATLTLTGANSYTGATTVTQGALSLGTPYLNDAADVILATGATLNLTHAATDTIDQLIVNGAAQSPGVYGAVGSGAQFERAFITGSGLLQVTTGGSGGYATWAADHAGGQAANLDFDFDGVPNGVEYFMGVTTPGFTKNPAIIDGKVTWPMSPDFIGAYQVQTSNDLVNWAPATTGVLETTGVSVSYTLPAGDPKRFARIQVTVP